MSVRWRRRRLSASWTRGALRVGAWALALCALSSSGPARAEPDARAGGIQDEALGSSEAYARVVVDSAALRTGPGALFAVVRVARRGETFLLRERATRGYWFRVELPDGQRAWIAGDVVYVEEAPRAVPGWVAWLFGPPPLPSASGELSVSLGVLGGAGLMAVRPCWLLAPSFGFEANLAGAVGGEGRVLLAGGGALINLFASAPVVPFFAIGGGGAYATPNLDSFVLEGGKSSLLYAGGGLRLGFKRGLVLRLEGRQVLFFEPDRSVAQQEISGGFSAFF